MAVTILHNRNGMRARRRALWTAGLALALGTSGAARAQDVKPTWMPREKARIGVMLTETCEISGLDAVRCDSPPVVSSVVVDGPADRAGVLAGDVLVSVDGLDVRTGEGRAALSRLANGVAVELVLTRYGEIKTVEVVPETRPAGAYVDVRTRLLSDPGPDGPVLPGEIRIVRVPSVQGRLDEVEIRLDSLRRQGNEFVFFQDDSTGALKVEVGGPEQADVFLERIREHERHGDRQPGYDEVSSGGEGLALQGEGVVGDPAELPRYVWENHELARRLIEVRESSLRSARAHLDSLVRLRSRVALVRDSSAPEIQFHFRTDPGVAWSSEGPLRPLTGELRTLFLTNLRVAGAEFRQLEGDLADYFEGADEGLLVMRVIDDTPASRLGLREGDVVIEVEREKCQDVDTLRRAIADAGPRGSLSLTWVRKGDRQTGRMEMN